MKLDPKTIMFTIIIGNLLMSSGLFLIARVYVGRTMGVSRWSRACVIQAMGWIITGALRGVIPDVVSIVLGQTLILLTLLIYMQVLAEFTGQTIRRRWFILPLLVEAIGLTYYSAVQENLVARIAIISLCACLVMCKSIAVLQDKQQKFGTSHRFTAALYMMCAGFMIFRTGYYFVVQPKLGVLPFEQNLINDVSYVVFYIFAVMLTFGFLLMCNERYITEQNIAVQQREEHHALFTKLSEQVPGVIYQYRQFSDGRSCFPFSSEGMREIYEVT
ncbi:MAG: hypothetical protein HYZ45_05145, partial [Burkholderiales bacterium]|nr:hypothetical protein [Burkholderiales bacterium]